MYTVIYILLKYEEYNYDLLSLQPKKYFRSDIRFENLCSTKGINF